MTSIIVTRTQRSGSRGDDWTKQHDDQDRLISYNGVSYVYQPSGELLTRTEGTEVTEYDYDPLGNLEWVILPNGDNLEILIDGRNRRIGKKRNGTLEQGFLYQDQLNPVAELDGSGAVVSRFVYASKINVPDYMVKGGVTYRIVSDHLSSVRLVVNTQDGSIAQRLDYDAFGRVLQDTNAGFQPFGFAGGLYDADTELVRFGARDYDPQTGRWTSKDPTRFVSGISNLYEYASGDPVNSLDITGLAEICSRALNGAPGQLGDLRHDQIWYEDGTNSGFFDDDQIRPDYIDPANPDKGQRSKGNYNSCKPIGKDKDVRNAEDRVKKDWNNNWRLKGNNCQHYVDAVLQDPGLITENIKPVGAVNIAQ